MPTPVGENCYAAFRCQSPLSLQRGAVPRPSLLSEYRLELALIDTPQGNWDAGERGLAALPGREDEFRAGVELAAD